MFYVQSTAEGHIWAKQNVILPQVQILIHYLIHIAPCFENKPNKVRLTVGQLQESGMRGVDVDRRHIVPHGSPVDGAVVLSVQLLITDRHTHNTHYTPHKTLHFTSRVTGWLKW